MTRFHLADINAMPLEAPPYKSPEHVRLPAVDFSPRSAPGAYPTLGIPQLLKYNGRNIQGMSRVAADCLDIITRNVLSGPKGWLTMTGSNPNPNPPQKCLESGFESKSRFGFAHHWHGHCKVSIGALFINSSIVLSSLHLDFPINTWLSSVTILRMAHHIHIPKSFGFTIHEACISYWHTTAMVLKPSGIEKNSECILNIPDGIALSISLWCLILSGLWIAWFVFRWVEVTSGTSGSWLTKTAI